MRRKRYATHVHWTLFLFYLVGFMTNRTSAQEQQPASNPYAEPTSCAGSFESVTSNVDTDTWLSPSAWDETHLELNQIQRLPSVDPQEDKPKEFGSGSGMGPGMGPGGGQGPIGYRTIWFPSASLKNQPGEWGMVGQDVSFMIPIWTDSPDMLMLNGGVRNRLITTDAIMPDSGKKYPDNLWNVTLGLMYMRKLANDQMFSCGVNIGSASDQPFGSIDEMNVSVMAMYRRPSGERNAWNFGLMYSPTGEIQFPIPMISYLWNPSDQFQMSIGLPFRIMYRPDDRWTFEASYMPIHTISAKASYRFCDKLRLVGGYTCTNEAYSLYDRTDSSDRFFLFDQRVSLGLESPVCKWVTVDLTAGYAFDRYSYIGQQWDSAQYDRVDISDGPFIMLGLQLRR
jgi:hypothetical protein